MEEMGMTDLQFKSHLKGVVAELEHIKEKARDDEGEVVQELDKMIQRFKSDIES